MVTALDVSAASPLKINWKVLSTSKPGDEGEIM